VKREKEREKGYLVNQMHGYGIFLTSKLVKRITG